MWQSIVEIDYYYVVYFDHITAIKAPLCWTSAKGRAHTCFMDLLGIYTFMKHLHMTSTFNRSSAVWWFKRGNTIELHDRIIFDFYTGLSCFSLCACDIKVLSLDSTIHSQIQYILHCILCHVVWADQSTASGYICHTKSMYVTRAVSLIQCLFTSSTV